MKGNFKIFKEGTDVSHGQTLQHEEMLGVGGGGTPSMSPVPLQALLQVQKPQAWPRKSLCDHHVTTGELKCPEREPEAPGNREWTIPAPYFDQIATSLPRTKVGPSLHPARPKWPFILETSAALWH